MCTLALFALSAAAAPIDALAPLGTDHLDAIEELRFTFVVERDAVVKSRREWSWRPNEGTVTRTVDGQSLAFRFGHPTNDQERKADAQFVNDSFWLLPHLHARWAGADLSVVDGGMVEGPLGVGTTHLLRLDYARDGGGYSPGDAYDLFLDPAGRIVAWRFREGGQPEPSLTTTFERWEQVGPLTIATERRDEEARAGDPARSGFRLLFTDLAVVTRGAPAP